MAWVVCQLAASRRVVGLVSRCSMPVTWTGMGSVTYLPGHGGMTQRVIMLGPCISCS